MIRQIAVPTGGITGPDASIEKQKKVEYVEEGGIGVGKDRNKCGVL